MSSLRSHARRLRAFAFLLLWSPVALAQDERERLGPSDMNPPSSATTADHPITGLMQSVTWQIKPELRGKHPRVYVTAEEIAALQQRARTTHREMWTEVTENLGALQFDPPPPPAEERRAQNTVAIRLVEVALAYAVDKDPRYLAAAKTYMDAAVSYDVWGYSYNKPNVDLAAGHLLYGLGWAYDLLYDELTPAERDRYRAKLVRQGELLYEHYAPKPGRTYAYSQNHLFIPMAGLAVAGYALQGEAPEADRWSQLARALFDRVLATYSTDGYYYEGMEYWIFATPWLVHFLDAHAHATGEDLYDAAAGLKDAHLYVAHTLLPGAQDAFDFGDVYSGPLSRTGQDEERARTHPDGNFATNYNVLHRLADRFDNPDAQGVAAYLESRGQVNAEPFWSLLWYEPDLPATPIENLTPYHHFADHDVVYWRTGWDADATAFAFKCGPPEGHHATALVAAFPDWRPEAGHAHPDANSFILYAHGEYLTGDSGYAGVPRTDQHNTLLVDGKGQAREGEGHDAWGDYPYDRLDAIHITDVRLTPEGAFVQGDATSAYDTSLGVRRFVRNFLLTSPTSIVIWDDVETDRPSTITSLLHADEAARVEGDRITIERVGASLEVRVIAPDVELEVEPNYLVAPGSPGSIASGTTEARGERVRIQNVTPDVRTQFVYQFEIQGDEGRTEK